MAYGLQVYDAAGDLRFDPSNSVAFVLYTGIIDGKFSGSYNSPLIVVGKCFVSAVPARISGPGYAGQLLRANPTITITNGSVSWAPKAPSSYYTQEAYFSLSIIIKR